jgi:hypothetical protein
LLKQSQKYKCFDFYAREFRLGVPGNFSITYWYSTTIISQYLNKGNVNVAEFLDCVKITALDAPPSISGDATQILLMPFVAVKLKRPLVTGLGAPCVPLRSRQSKLAALEKLIR